MKKKLLNILFWSVISAAFIGPGTITTASLAGATYGVSLLWALLFSTLACIVLQEGAARITIASGLTIGEAVALKFGARPWVKWAFGGSVIFGCAAYEAGNIVGAITGAGLIFDIPPRIFTVMVAGATFAILWRGSASGVAKSLGILVAVMGAAFLYTAFFTRQPAGQIASGLFLPKIPPGSLLMVIGLIGTTIVPYNLFLGSGLGRNQNLAEMRFGLVVAVGLGGLVSMAVLLTGTGASLPFSFEEMGSLLKDRIGQSGSYLFAIGLFAAGFTSSITAPLASAITAQSIWGKGGTGDYSERTYRMVWVGVLLVGVVFGLLELRPVPVILLAQAINGLLLPVAAFGLLLVLNDAKLMNSSVNGHFANALGLFIAWATLFLGVNQIVRTVYTAFYWELPPADQPYIMVILVVSLLPLGVLIRKIFRK